MVRQLEAAAFIGSTCLELNKLAKSADLPFLAVLLEIASLEAAKNHECLFAQELLAQGNQVQPPGIINRP